MKNHVISCVCTLAGVLAWSSEVRAQPATPSGSTPNLSGVWTVTNYRAKLADMSSELAATKLDPPFTLEGAVKYKNADRATLDTGPSSRCLPPGIAFLMVMPYAFEIIQIPGRVLTYHEFGNYVRQIFTDGRDHKDAYPTWLGHSIGRYEGDTLVVDTVGFNGKAWLDQTGLQGSDALHTVERFRRMGSELEYSITIEDPKMFTRSWTAQAKFKEQKNFNIVEFVCMENNTYLGSPGMQIPANK